MAASILRPLLSLVEGFLTGRQKGQVFLRPVPSHLSDDGFLYQLSPREFSSLRLPWGLFFLLGLVYLSYLLNVFVSLDSRAFLPQPPRRRKLVHLPPLELSAFSLPAGRCLEADRRLQIEVASSCSLAIDPVFLP